MLRHVLWIAALTVAGLAIMFYPFMPGRYDQMASPLSGTVQVGALTGMLLVPIGLAWTLYEFTDRRRTPGSPGLNSKPYWFAGCALAASLLTSAGVALLSLQSGVSFAVATLALCAYATWRAAGAVTRLRTTTRVGFNVAPLYLTIIPSVLCIARLAFLDDAVVVSRNRTIEGSTALINAIEAYQVAHGSYPLSVESVHHDYDPPTVGVERYRYESDGQSYRVFFEQLTWPIGTQEFVMYSPRDQHTMMVHNQDILESPRQHVDAERNFHARAARATGVPHWKYFWFD